VLLAKGRKRRALTGVLDDRHARTVAAGGAGRYERDIASLSALPGE